MEAQDTPMSGPNIARYRTPVSYGTGPGTVPGVTWYRVLGSGAHYRVMEGCTTWPWLATPVIPRP